jgi:RimJ/RimL family protein N-acetyltransferase
VIDASNYLVQDTLKDGRQVNVRAMRSDDWQGVLAAFHELDRESIYTRFFIFKKSLSDDELDRITNVDFDSVVALLVTALDGDEERLLGGGRYATGDGADGARSAEVAFLSGAHARGQGVASLLLKHLTRIGRERDLSRFEASVLPQNQPMLAVFRHSGLPMTVENDGTTIHVILSLAKPAHATSQSAGPIG